MSHDARPISPTRFREAIQDLPIGNLHAKAAELRNSIDHLKRSNEDLADFPHDPDCKQAVTENLEVIQRMENRVLMLKQEVEGRGLRWVEGDDYKEGMLEPGEGVVVNGANGQTSGVNGTARGGGAHQLAAAAASASAPSGRLTDEQLARLLAERMGEPDDNDEEEEGVHL